MLPGRSKPAFRRIPPSVETGPSTCGAQGADGEIHAEISNLVRSALGPGQPG
jgi:hypothetical protein